MTRRTTPTASRPSRWRMPPMLLMGVATVLLVIAGCRNRTVVIDPSTATDEGGEPRSNCEEILSNAVSMLQPDRLGVTTDRAQVADLLNQWGRECAKLPETAPPEETGKTAQKLLKDLTPSQDVEPLGSNRFVNRDVDHLRTAILLKKACDSIIQSADRDLDRVKKLFGWVVRNIALVPESSERLPLTPFEIVLFGRGTAEDRAWVFAELLRQIRIDAIIVRPAADPPSENAEGKTGPWLVGVILDEPEKPIYLFDAVLGTPIPAPGPIALDPDPATWKQAAENPDVFKAIVVDEKDTYPITAASLAKADVELISSADLCRSRYRPLQDALSGNESILIFDPIDDLGEAPGSFTRVMNAADGRWTAEQVRLWPHAERNSRGIETLDDRQRQRLIVRQAPFATPLSVLGVGADGKPKFGAPKKIQFTTRVSQLTGDRQAAIRSYQIVRTDGQLFESDPSIPPEIGRMHGRAGEDAFFWTAVCQFELGEFGAAAQSFSDYLRAHPDSDWTDHARGMMARSFAAQEKFAAAVQALNTIDVDDPARAGHQLMQKRYRELREKPKPTATPEGT